MGMHPYIPPPNFKFMKKQSTPSLFEELTSILPLTKIEALKQQKLETSNEYASFYRISTSYVYKNLYCEAIKSSEIEEIMNQAESHGLHPLRIHDFVRTLFGIESVKC